MPLRNQISSVSIPETHMKFSHGLKISLKDIVYGTVHMSIDSAVSHVSLCFSHSDSQKSTADERSYKLPSFQICASLLGTYSADLAYSTECIYWA